MQFRTNSFIIVCGIILVSSLCFAQENEAVTVEHVVPYIAEIVGAGVNVRSGPGIAYYSCTKLNAPNRVTVVGEDHGWAEVLPPAGSFSWILKTYVRLEEANPRIGVVTGEVRVWAGAEGIEAANSPSPQPKLNEGDIVKLMPGASENGDYYKIYPPTGAHLYVDSRYLKYISPVPKARPILPPRPTATSTPTSIALPATEPEPATDSDAIAPPATEPEPAVESDAGLSPAAADSAPPVAIATQPPVVSTKGKEALRVNECHALAEQINIERKKEPAQQSYVDIKEKLTGIFNDPYSGKAKRYAEFELDRICSFELACMIDAEVKKQDQTLAKTREQLRAKHSAQLTTSAWGKYIAVGILKESNIYTSEAGQKRYLIVADTGKIVCYAVPADNAAKKIGADKFLSVKVGLMGEIVKDPHSRAGLVKFTSIEELQ